MKNVFADSLFWTAVIRPDDPYRRAAIEAAADCEGAVMVTPEEVLSEFLAAVSKYDQHVRAAAVKAVEVMLRSAGVQVLAQSHDITKVLTNDHHFEQEGFEVLIR